MREAIKRGHIGVDLMVSVARAEMGLGADREADGDVDMGMEGMWAMWRRWRGCSLIEQMRRMERTERRGRGREGKRGWGRGR